MQHYLIIEGRSDKQPLSERQVELLRRGEFVRAFAHLKVTATYRHYCGGITVYARERKHAA